MKYLITILFLSTLYGCGGGSTPNAGAPTATAINTQQEVLAEETDTTVERTQDLEVTTQFDFSSRKNIQVSITPENIDVRFDFITICKATAEGDVETRHCLLRTPVPQEAHTLDIEVTNDTAELIVSLWDFENPNANQNLIKSINNNTTNLSI